MSGSRDELSLGTMIREHRLACGMSVGGLAERVGCAKSYVSLIEHGRKGPPSEPMLRRFEAGLGLEPGALVERARMARMPPEMRTRLRRLEEDRRLGRRLASLLRTWPRDEPGGAEPEDPEPEGAEPEDPEPEGAEPEDAGPDPDEPDRAAATANGAGEPREPRERRESGGPGRVGDGAAGGSRSVLDAAYHSGELRRLVERLAPEGGGPAHADVAPVSLPMEVPLINSVAAGYPTEFTDLGYPARVADEYVRCPDLHDPDAFAARVVGDSMSPEYREGDIVIFSPMRDTPHGSDCFARLEPDHETTFKRVYFETGAGGESLIRLQPLNSAHPPRVVPREQVAGLYAAVSVMRSLV